MDIVKKGMLSGVCFFVPLMSYAQNLYLPDVHEAVAKYFASGSNNTAFLTEFPLQRASYLQGFASKGNGDFVNFNQSDNTYGVGLTTESYYRFNDRIMLYGKVSYDMNRGKNMTGSSFVFDDDDLPFDLVEMVDSCAGSKRMEAYTLSGALGYQLSEKVSLGGKVFYQAANYAKFKDLRHQNSRMKLNVDLGVTYRPLSWLNLGLSYTYHRRNEAIAFDVYGNTDKQYYTLIDFGGFFGRSEAFGESGYTSESTPLFTQTHGGAVQAHLAFGKNFSWFNEFYYHSSDGRFGTGDDRDIIFSTHNGNVFGYKGKALLEQQKNTQVIEVAVSKRLTENYENNYKESTDADGVSQIIYYGKNEMLDRKKWNAAVSYTFYRKSSYAARSQFSAGGRFLFSSTDSKTSVYPFFRKQTVNVWQSDVYGTYNWFKNKQVFTVSLLMGYGAGGGTMKEDGVYIPVSGDQKKPARRDDLLLKQYDYLTASRVHGQLTFGYERNLLKNLSGYVNAAVSPRYALNSSLEDTSYLQFDIQIGVKF